MKKVAIALVLAMLVGILAGCAGTAVVYYGSECTCPTEGEAQVTTQESTQTTVPAGDGLLTGIAVVTSVSGSKGAEGDNAGQAKYDITIAAVLVDSNGVIVDCIIDSVGTNISFDGTGNLLLDPSAPIMTKRELGEGYGMKANGSQYEWYEQADALAQYAVGKTVDELKNGAVDETGLALDADLASCASIYLGGYVQAIELAVQNAQYLGAKSGDELRLAVSCSASSSKSAAGENAGTAQLDCDVTALTLNNGVITSCVIDSVQAKVGFDANGGIVGDLSAPILTKNQLGEEYGMKKYGAQFEWNEQAAAFAQYVTGKTADEVANIAINEETRPTDADLAATVTITIGGFQALIQKAAA